MSKRYEEELSLEALQAMPDEDIDLSDMPELDDAFWENATLVMPKKKQALSLRLDHEVIAHFKAQGPGYQTRINAVLKSYVKAQKAAS